MGRQRVRCGVTVAVIAGLSGVCGHAVRAAASACPDSQVGTVTQDVVGLQVVQPTMSPLQPGDVLLQLNGQRLQTCADLSAALGAARTNAVAPLFLIRRGPQTIAVVAEWPVPPPAATPPVAAATNRPPSAVPTAPPARLSRADADATRVLLADLVTLGDELQDHQPLPMAQPWAGRVERLRQEYDTQQARGVDVSVLNPILGLYEVVVEILRYKETATRARRDIRARSEVVLEYDSGSAVSAWLRHYPFLQPSVIRAPEPSRVLAFETNGLWAPDRAVALLIERARSEGAALSGRLETSRAHP
jgi:hypothetical protein